MMGNRKAMPPLTADELILLVDAYFELESVTDPAEKMTILRELSDSMRALPFFPEYKGDESFRSVAGMTLCLAKLTDVDPLKKSRLGRATEGMRRIFIYYYERRELLHGLANAIKRLGSYDFPIVPFADPIMGRLVLSYHMYLEQQNRTVKNAKKMILSQGRAVCAVCGCDLEACYPGHGRELLEVHIALPAVQQDGHEKITMSDLLFLCPTCHRLAHRTPFLMEAQGLREAVKGR